MSVVSHRPRHLCILDQQSWEFPGHPRFYHDSRPESPVCTHRSLRMRRSLRGRIGGYSGQYSGFQVFDVFVSSTRFLFLDMYAYSYLMPFSIGISCHMLSCCEDDLGYHWNLPPGNNSKYLMSLDNWYYNHVVEYVDHLYIGFCFKLPYFLPRSVLCWPPRSSLSLVDPFDLFGHV